VPVTTENLRVELARRPAGIPGVGAEGRVGGGQRTQHARIRARVDAVDDLARLLAGLAGAKEDDDPLARHRPSDENHVVARAQFLDVGQDSGEPDIGRAVDDEPERAARVVVDEQHDRRGEVRIAQAPIGDEETPRTESRALD